MESKSYRAVGYRRVSMREQVDGHSLDAQETHIREYAQVHGWQVTAIYTDAGISAKKDSRRPELERLMADTRAGKFDVVIVDKIDRFYRHLNGLLTALEQLHSHNVTFVSVQEKLDFTTHWGKLTLTVLGTLAEAYLDNLRQETKKGKRQRAREGFWNGNIPYGYCNGLCTKCTDPNGAGYCPAFDGLDQSNGKLLIPHPIDSQVVKQAFALYAAGGVSDARVADYMNQLKVALSDGRELQVRQKGVPGQVEPRPFSKDMLRGLLQNVFYTGKVAYRGVDAQGHRHKRCPPLEVSPGQHPPLIDEDTFQRVQELRGLYASNTRRRQAGEVRIFPLTGLLRCGYCGENLRGVSSRGYDRYYRDASQIDHRQKCHQPLVRADQIEAQVVRFLRKIVDNLHMESDLKQSEHQELEAKTRFERAKALYLLGEIPRETYETEKSRQEIVLKGLQFSAHSAIFSLLKTIQQELSGWDELSPIKRKRALRLALEALYVRENALAAVQPTFAFLPLLRECSPLGECCTSGPDGI